MTELRICTSLIAIAVIFVLKSVMSILSQQKGELVSLVPRKRPKRDFGPERSKMKAEFPTNVPQRENRDGREIICDCEENLDWQ
jgi:hypothetical protein